jgi:hypothetical protein
MLNKNFTLPEDMREAVIAGSLRILFPEAERGTPEADGDGNALWQLEDAGFRYLENIAEELTACLVEVENGVKTAAKAERP